MSEMIVFKGHLKVYLIGFLIQRLCGIFICRWEPAKFEILVLFVSSIFDFLEIIIVKIIDEWIVLSLKWIMIQLFFL
jgi:hypothetical protein